MSLQGLVEHGEAGGTVESGTDKAQAQEQVWEGAGEAKMWRERIPLGIADGAGEFSETQI